jgi:subtilisin family serine protease
MRASWLGLAAGLGTILLPGCTDQVEPNPSAPFPASASATTTSGVNVILRSQPTSAILADLNTVGTVLDLIPQLNAVLMRATAADLKAIRAKPYVAAASMDKRMATRTPPAVVVEGDFLDGRSMWNLDAINVTVSPDVTGRNPDLKGVTGKGVYVGVLDSGLIPEWRSLFPAERIDVGRAIAFGGGGGEKATVSTQPDKWQKDVDGHGTVTTSIILGYLISGTTVDGKINGVAPEATVIPVRVIGQDNSGTVSTVARGVVYMADLKAGPLANHPVVINLSIGSFEQDPLENAALDYAIGKGVIVVVSAGNQGTAGMTYPGAYPPVISVAATGSVRQWQSCNGMPFGLWVERCDMPEPTSPADFYLTQFSSRELPGQQLDLAAPGVWIVTPAPFRGGFAFGFAWGTSFAAPHVTGTLALMAEKDPSLRQAEAEAILKSTAIPLPAGTRTIFEVFNLSFEVVNQFVTVSWGADATGAGMLDAAAAVKAAH